MGLQRYPESMKDRPALPIVALAVLVVVGAVLLRSGEPSHLVVVRFDPRLALAEPPGTVTPRLDALESTSAKLTWNARSDALEAELDGLATKLAEEDWTVHTGNVVDVALTNAAAAKERGDPGPYFVNLTLAARNRADLGGTVGRVIDGLAAVLPPAETVFVVVDPKGGAILAHGPGVDAQISDPAGDAAAVRSAIEGWAGL
jgi:hypothetical protein